MTTKTFREFLQEKAHDRSQEERRKRREEWVAAVDRLIAQLRVWLQEADAEGVLEIVPLSFDKIEEGLGNYRVQGLQIFLGGTEVQVIPVAGNVASPREFRATGRVDVTNGAKKYILYRVRADGVEDWRVCDDRYQVSAFDQSRFEEIMQDLLS